MPLDVIITEKIQVNLLPSPLKAVEVPLSPDSSEPWVSNTVALMVTTDNFNDYR